MNVMHKLSMVLAWLLAAFFLFGAYGNTFVSAENAAAYAAWGYPEGFHYFTALLELSAALLLMRTATRLFGAALGTLVMAVATLTTLVNADYAHAVAPSIVLLVCLMMLGVSRIVRRATATNRRTFP